MKKPAHKPGFSERFFKNTLPIAGCVGAFVVTGMLQDRALEFHKSRLAECLTDPMKVQRDECIDRVAKEGVSIEYGLLATRALTAFGAIYLAGRQVNSWEWKPVRNIPGMPAPK